MCAGEKTENGFDSGAPHILMPCIHLITKFFLSFHRPQEHQLRHPRMQPQKHILLLPPGDVPHHTRA